MRNKTKYSKVHINAYNMQRQRFFRAVQDAYRQRLQLKPALSARMRRRLDEIDKQLGFS